MIEYLTLDIQNAVKNYISASSAFLIEEKPNWIITLPKVKQASEDEGL